MPVRYCLGLESPELADTAARCDLDAFKKTLCGIAGGGFGVVLGLPSLRWHERRSPTHVIVQLAFDSHTDAQRFRSQLQGKFSPKRCGFGVDPRLAAFDVWPNNGPGGGIFADRDAADALTGVGALGDATGKGVNVLIVDRGLEENVVARIANRMGRRRLGRDITLPCLLGWSRDDEAASCGSRTRHPIHPGTTGSQHAHMIARNVLAIAPEARIWDAPLLPGEAYPDGPPGPGDASTLYRWLRKDVRGGSFAAWNRTGDEVEVDVGFQPWVVVNAWGVMNPEDDCLLEYCDDPDHLMVNDLPRLDSENIDVVFAAGNCGEPSADHRCGGADRGPGCSIYGLNAHPSVLSVGAVRADGVAIGNSAQGPGRLARSPGSRGTDFRHNEHARCKPDLCAPSHFREPEDAAEVNTGTSAACGYAAGVIAALRSTREGWALTPEGMRDLLRNTAQGDRSWDPRLGFGVIQAGRALASLCGQARGH